MIYLDNAATTFPKPREVLDRMIDLYAAKGVSPGRGGYDLALEAEELVSAARKRLCRFFGGDDPERVIFASNATDALNLVIQGAVKPGGHVVSSQLEHNSVLRPLHYLRGKGLIDYDLVPFDDQGFIDPDDVVRAIRPETDFVLLTHASNALGTIQPVEAIGTLCRERGIPLIIDAAQSAGVVPINISAWGVSAVAFTGHKSLLGPTGIGGLILSRGLEVQSTRFGGTGIDSQELTHTQTYPHRLEAGTSNFLGVLGLMAGLDYLAAQGMERILEKERALARRLWEGLAGMGKVKLYGGERMDRRLGVVLANVEGMIPADVAAILDGDFGIATRAGLHCAPLVHRRLGTGRRGGVRFSLGPFNTSEDIDRVLEAMAKICATG
ncbi:MAG: aminotransferase class V-fold PLP-dependent enzyme [Deltaproteobacteria bacterium]|nr:aminotransferase class V-fold PLP-dependent enzyme [Deltaproteobacteria bacterium]